MKSLYLAIQQHESRRWSPVAKVTKNGGVYRLVYTKGAWEVPGFSGFARMEDLYQEYRSAEIFPILKNRTLPRSRPEYQNYILWLGLSPEEHDELDELARSGGIRATDQIELIPAPERKEDGSFEAFFFVRGISDIPGTADIDLKIGDRLFVMKDFQNEQDSAALLLRTGDPVSVVGYAPRYYSHDLSRLAELCPPQDLLVTVERLNNNAPAAYKVLCKVVAPWPAGFDFFGSHVFDEVPKAPVS
ncbi:HIRAN domain-containing protein [Xanthomonas campestris]|uniref:HIRAN domain-containing protein n=1 Tax=Xanthomonas campestris TaxID=339 RepID=UPI001E640BE2|nr:HIRAN domain-containing protein [Xanthomonas campestris]MCC5049254.1 HIRAN domain-containing protein [Xanthomonas campestris]MCC5057497.1 HIRAN domain-containing protein [Xanthomonas campestris]MCC5061473.1 HIRAN domain-containing protein [Xanthomonas campestris]